MPKPHPGERAVPGGRLTLFDAVNISLGSIIGAGIFVILGAAAAVAGPALVLSVLIAAFVSLLTGLSTAELSRIYPRSGGVYVFARETLSGFLGFLVGWVWLFSNVVGGATVAVGFGHYLTFFFPKLPTGVGIVAVVMSTVMIHLGGAKESSRFNNALVLFKIAVLLFFSAAAFLHFQGPNFRPFLPFGFHGVWAGAATIFFAYAGFARVAIVADEIEEPQKNVPRATLISIFISTAVYLIVTVAAVGGAGSALLAGSGSPLADALRSMGLAFGARLVALGGLAAAGSVALAAVLGVSRLAQVMARNGELPAFIGRSGGRGAAPRNAILIGGGAMLALAFAADLPHIAYISSFSLLLYYAALNLSGLKVLKGGMRIVTGLGLVSCLVLMANLPRRSWVVGAAVVASGAIYHWGRTTASRRKSTT
ncbi:MAG: amino acid permease [Candidatus Aminicenantes bacterium]|nr:MAG: amino acid permease [Candidatus Aminicenantes bacterium]